MNAPCYIYFEEHHPVSAYVKVMPKTQSSFTGFPITNKSLERRSYSSQKDLTLAKD